MQWLQKEPEQLEKTLPGDHLVKRLVQGSELLLKKESHLMEPQDSIQVWLNGEPYQQKVTEERLKTTELSCNRGFLKEAE